MSDRQIGRGSQEWRGYCSALPGAFDVSFEADGLVWPLTLEQSSLGVLAEKHAILGGGPHPAPIPYEACRAAALRPLAGLHAEHLNGDCIRAGLRKIDEIALEHRAKYIWLESRSAVSSVDFNEFGYGSANGSCFIVDASDGWFDRVKSDARRRMRQSLEKLDFIVVGRGPGGCFWENASPEVEWAIKSMRDLKVQQAGSELWNDEIWRIRERWACDGLAILTGARLKGSGHTPMVGWWYTGLEHLSAPNDAEALWAAADPDYLSHHIGYGLAHETIRWLSEKGKRLVDVGQGQFGWRAYDAPSPKDLSISVFKSRLGGSCRALYRWEKFYDPDFGVLVAEARLDRLKGGRLKAALRDYLRGHRSEG